MKLRPLQGKILVEMLPQESESQGGVLIPIEAQEKSKIGIVRKLGIWRQFKSGALQPFPVRKGEKVLINARRGRWVNGETKKLKIVDQEDVLAVIP